MVRSEEPCGPGREPAWALWLDRSTIAWPRRRAHDGLAYRLQGHPHVQISPGELTPADQDRDWRTKKDPYIALRLHHDTGEPLAGEEAGDILRGPLQLMVISEGRVVERSSVQIAGVLDDVFAGAREQTLGVSWEDDIPTLRVWAPTASRVRLELWRGETFHHIPARRDGDGVWTVRGERNWEDATYLWEVRGFVSSVGSLVTTHVTDPYSVGLTIDSKRSVIVNRDRARWTPKLWGSFLPSALRTPAEQAVYELHVRDFSAWDPTVPESLRGTYRAFLVEGSQGTHELRRLAEAGVTTLHLLPTFDIATAVIPEARVDQRVPAVKGIPLIPANEERLDRVEGWSRSSTLQQGGVGAASNVDAFNWGYDPFHWMTPEGSYASPGYQVGGLRTLEYREMVLALHKMGLRVVQDVVFNHTFGCGQGKMSVLDKIVPGYYHRLDASGAVERSTCCANIATEHAMAEKLMVDALVDAAIFYHVDGFRFDLMGHHSLANLRAVRTALDALTARDHGVEGRQIYLYGEGWNFGEVANDALFIQATQANIAGTGIGVFNDYLRNAVRGGSPLDEDHRFHQGFATGLWVDPNEVANASEPKVGGAPAVVSGAEGWEDPARSVALPSERVRGEAQGGSRERLLRSMDLIKTALTGAIKGYPLVSAGGRSDDLEHYGQPEAFADQPGECVNYVEAHDDETLFDAAIWKLPLTTAMEDRVRVQVLANATVALGQGVAFWSAGTELLRSKSLDRDSYNSGDWFNAIDWSGQWNHFGRGLPSAGRNERYWPAMAPLLDREELRPEFEAMNLCREIALDMLRIRVSSPLFTLGEATLVRTCVTFPPTGNSGEGPGDEPGVISMVIDGRNAEEELGSLDYLSLLVIFNARPDAWRGTISALKGREYVLHPVQEVGADLVVRRSIWKSATAEVEVPGRTVAVFVEQG